MKIDFNKTELKQFIRLCKDFAIPEIKYIEFIVYGVKDDKFNYNQAHRYFMDYLKERGER